MRYDSTTTLANVNVINVAISLGPRFSPTQLILLILP